MNIGTALVRSAIRGVSPRLEQREVWPTISIDEWASLAGAAWPFGFGQSYQLDREEISGSFESIVSSAYKANGVVFAVEAARLMLFSQAVFKFRRLSDLSLFGSPELAILETPWRGGTTADLLNRLLQTADMGGTGFAVRRASELRVPRPDWMSILVGSNSDPDIDAWDLDATIIGYLYHPGGRYSGRRPMALLPDSVAHFSPTSDPMYHYLGVPWLEPVIRDIQGDKSATTHKLRFFENAATPQIIVSLGDKVTDGKRFREWVDVFEQEHAGATNAYRTLYLAAGASAQVVGANLQQMDFKSVQGAGETRIAAAAGVPVTVVGLSEGLQGSALNAGNYQAAMRRFADLVGRSLWANVCGSLAPIINVPGGSELWYDESRIQALKEDIKDAAEVIGIKATSIRTLVDGGFRPDYVVAAVTSGDLAQLSGEHTGLLPVQLQAPGAGSEPGDAEEPTPPRMAPPGEDFRCGSCHRLLAEFASVGTRIRCGRCGTLNSVAA